MVCITLEYYKLQNLSETRIVRLNDSFSAVTLSTIIKASLTIATEKIIIFIIKGSQMFCPDQELMAVTYPLKNTSDITMHKAEGTIAEPGEKSFTVIVKRGFEYACDVVIIAAKTIEIDRRSINFSAFMRYFVKLYTYYFCLLLKVHSIFKTVMYPLTTPPY